MRTSSEDRDHNAAYRRGYHQALAWVIGQMDRRLSLQRLVDIVTEAERLAQEDRGLQPIALTSGPRE